MKALCLVRCGISVHSLALNPNSPATTPVRSRWKRAQAATQRAAQAVGRLGKATANQAHDAAAAGYSALAAAVSTGKRAVGTVQSRIDSRISRSTGIEFDWSSAILTVGTAGFGIYGRHRTRRWAQQAFHDGPGHWDRYRDINRWIDGVGRKGFQGRDHRLKYGHSVEYLPDLVARFGPSAIPAYAVHLAQDVTTIRGIPLIPFARLAKVGLQRVGVRRAIATTCVTANLASIIGCVGTALILWEVGSLGYEIYSQARRQRQKSSPATPWITQGGDE